MRKEGKEVSKGRGRRREGGGGGREEEGGKRREEEVGGGEKEGKHWIRAGVNELPTVGKVVHVLPVRGWEG